MDDKKKHYEYLIFDADHTLINYSLDEKRAFTALFRSLGMQTSEEMLDDCRLLSVEAWDEAGLSRSEDPVIQQSYHSVYHGHLPEMFERIFTRYPVPDSLTGGTPPTREFLLDICKKFMVLLEDPGIREEGAEEVLRALSERTGGKYKICVATNGLVAMQKGRLRELAPYFYKWYISEDIGTIKPASKFFSHMLADLGAQADKCLMIGDSFSSDIVGAKRAGLDACWLNARGAELPRGADVAPDYIVRNLKELLALPVFTPIKNKKE